MKFKEKEQKPVPLRKTAPTPGESFPHHTHTIERGRGNTGLEPFSCSWKISQVSGNGGKRVGRILSGCR